MARFCGKCGAPVEEDARVCGNCGAPLVQNGGMPKMNIPANGGAGSADKEKLKMIGICAGAAVAALVVIIILVRIISANTGYRGTLNKFFAAYSKCDSEKMISCISDYYADPMKEQYDGDYEDMDDQLTSEMSSLEDSYGEHIKLSYKILKTKKMSKNKLEDLKSSLEDSGYNDDYDTDCISKAVTLKIKITVKGADDRDSTNVDGIVMVKENGKWKFADTTLSSMGLR